MRKNHYTNPWYAIHSVPKYYRQRHLNITGRGIPIFIDLMKSLNKAILKLRSSAGIHDMNGKFLCPLTGLNDFDILGAAPII